MTEPMTPDLAVATLRGWADHMRAENSILQTRSGAVISADVLDTVLRALDAERSLSDRRFDEVVELTGERVTLMLQLADAKRALKAAEAERDAAEARAMPGWRYLATWADVNAVEAQHNSEPAPGLYIVWKPGWPYPSAASVQFGVFATDEESPAPDDYFLGAWIIGPLQIHDLPTPTAAQEG